MLKYKELIKHPIPPVKPEYIELAKQEAKELWLAYLYHAEIINGVLALTLYLREGRNNDKLRADMRHFFDGECWVMQRISDNKKLTSSLPYYSHYGRRVAVDGADEVISSYFGDSEQRGLALVFDRENSLLDERLNARHKKELDVIDARMANVAEKPPAEFFDWLDNTALAHARYFFYEHHKRKKQTGYCSHCKTTFTAVAKNSGMVICPSCGSKLHCKSYGKISRYGITDSVSVTYVEEITENGKPTLAERCFYVRQDICHAESGVGVMHKAVGYSEFGRVFYAGDNLKPKKDELGCSMYNYGVYKQRGSIRWCNAGGSVYQGKQLLFPGNLDGIMKKCKVPAIRNIELSAVVPHLRGSFGDFAEALEKYSFLENLAKQKMWSLLFSIFDNQHLTNDLMDCLTPGVAACDKALGIDKEIFRKFAERDVTRKEYLLYMYAAKPSMPVFERLLKLKFEEAHRTVGIVVQNHRISAERLAGYIEKQCRLLNSISLDTLGLYRDYLSMARELRLPRTESVLFPKNLRQEHDRLIPIKAKKDYAAQEKQLKKRVQILEMLDYSDDDFLIRPLRTTAEFLKESSVLNHCVKTYIDRCAKGETNIYGIRKVSDPETPYFTLTLSNEAAVTMNLGKNNCQPPQEVKDFVVKWQKTVIRKKKLQFIEAANPPKDKKKVRITA